MATSLSLLKAYGSDSDNESTDTNESINENEVVHTYKPIDPSLSIISTITVDSAPLVHYSVNISIINLYLILY